MRLESGPFSEESQAGSKDIKSVRVNGKYDKCVTMKRNVS